MSQSKEAATSEIGTLLPWRDVSYSVANGVKANGGAAKPTRMTPSRTFERVILLRHIHVATSVAQCGVTTIRSAEREDVVMIMKRIIAAGLSAGLLFATALVSVAGEYGPGATDTEVKIGNTMPYSGQASAYGIIGKTEAAYFKMINEQGGINGRKINFISRDDGYSPPKTVELVRKMVEEDQVLFLFSTLGTPTNTANHSYINENKVPQLFAATGADQWNDPKHFPWTMGLIPSYGTEAHIYARYILKHLPNAKIAVLYQNDDFGKDYLNGLRDRRRPRDGPGGRHGRAGYA